MFKGTDIAMVEEIKEVECDFEKIQAEIGNLEKDLHVVEAEMESLACESFLWKLWHLISCKTSSFCSLWLRHPPSRLRLDGNLTVLGV